MANAEECINNIIEASKGVLSKQEAGELLRKFNDSTKHLSLEERTGSLSDMMDQFRENSVRRNQVFDVWKKQTELLYERDMNTASSHIDNAFEKIGKRGNGAKSYKEAFDTWLFGRPGERGGAVGRYEGTRERFNIALKAPLEEGGLLAHWKDKTTLDSAIEFAFDTSASVNGQEAQSIGGILRDVISLAGHRLNKAGAYVLPSPRILFNERVAAPDKVQALGIQRFREFVAGLNLDKEAFHGMEDKQIQEHFDKVYETLSTGGQYKAPTGTFDGVGGLTKERFKNLASTNSMDLGIPFADAKSYKAFAEKFADEPLHSLLARRVDQIGRSVGLMENFSSSPDRLVRDLLAKYGSKMGETDRTVLLNKGIPLGKETIGHVFMDAHPEDVINKMLGVTDNPASETVARLGAGARALGSLMSLPNGLFAQANDLATRIGYLEKFGRGPFQTIMSPITAIAQTFPNAERKEFYTRLGISADVLRHNMAQQFDPGITNRVSKVVDSAFKLGGMPTVDRIMKQSTADIMSSNLAWALREGNDHHVLDLFKSYGLDDSDFINLKKAIGTVNGMEVVDPKLVEKAGGKLYDKYLTAMNGIISVGTPTPGLREQTASSKGLRAGTVAGEAMRVFMQFRSYPSMLYTRVFPEIYYERGAAGILTTGISMIAAYYLSDTAKQLAAGKTPKDMTKIQNIMDVLVRSGFGGLYGDMLTNDYKSPGGLAKTIGGPTVAHVGDALGLAQDVAGKGFDVAQGKMTADQALSKLGTHTAHTLDRSLPVPFYAKTVLEHSLIYGMMEMSDPGSVNRMYKELNARTGQERLF